MLWHVVLVVVVLVKISKVWQLARQAAIVDNLMFNLDNTALEFVTNNQFIADQVATLVNSAKLSDMATRNKIKLQPRLLSCRS